MRTDDTVTVLGTGRATAPPDTLVLDLQLAVHGRTVAEALAALTGASRAATDALPGTRLRTHGLGVHPRTDHQGRQLGSTAYQSLQLRVDDPSVAGELVQHLGGAVGDALTVHGLRQELADPGSLGVQARERAFADAADRARQYADLAGRRLGRVVRVREEAGGGQAPAGAEDARVALATGPVVDAADQVVVAVVEVTWLLED